MKAPVRQKIVIIGCGNVAWHLAKRFASKHQFDIFVYNHRPSPALEDFKKINCTISSNLNNILDKADFYVVCVSDKYIHSAAEKIASKNPAALLVHTSGSAELSELGERLHMTGVMYPLQTFSKNDSISWNDLPVIIESPDKKTLPVLNSFARLLSPNVHNTNYSQRLKLHLAAVMVNNFTNALYAGAASLFENNKSGNPGFHLLQPLAERTVAKLRVMDPLQAQTGPAKRGDRHVMKKHLELLEENPALKKIYKQLSKLIAKQQKAKYD